MTERQAAGIAYQLDRLKAVGRCVGLEQEDTRRKRYAEHGTEEAMRHMLIKIAEAQLEPERSAP